MTRWLLEDAGDDELRFRPESYPLPPARGRTALELDDDDQSSFTMLTPGPDDRPVPSAELDDYYVAELVENKLTLKRGPRLP